MKKRTSLKNNKGMATLESLVLLVVFVVMSSYSIGFFGIIHTGIVNSIGARSLAFETLRNRANVTYWRDNKAALQHYKATGYRDHGIISELAEGVQGGASPYFGTARQIAFVRNPETQSIAKITNEGLPGGLETQEASPVLIKTKYGICLTAACGD